VWRGRSDGGGPFTSVAAGHLELVVTRLADLTMVTLRGPETRATTIYGEALEFFDVLRMNVSAGFQPCMG
jgi:hypothetical protein